MNAVSLVRKMVPWLALGLAATALPCINDLDTKRIEMETRFDVRSMVAGRYEVNPPVYYEMRVERLKNEIAKGTSDPNLYDDLSAAYERLGKTDEAIKVINRKLTLKAKFTSEDSYKFHANLGTFLAHKALAAQDGKPDKLLMKQALSHLEKAVEINPEAHFGREAAQIELVRALAEGLPEPKYFEHSDKTKNAYFGLAVMGAAQESPDVWVLAARHSSYSETDRQLIYERVRGFNEEKGFIFPALEDEFKAEYDYSHEVNELVGQLTNNGSEFQENRRGFILSQTKAGRHPDTDPEFWDGYEETIAYVAPEFKPDAFSSNLLIQLAGAFVILVGAVTGLALGVRWLLKR